METQPAPKPKLHPDTIAEVNQYWQKIRTMPPGPERDAQQQDLQDIARKLYEKFDVTATGEGSPGNPTETAGHLALKALNTGAGIMQEPFLYGAAKVTGKDKLAHDIITSWPGTYSPNEVAARVGIPPGPSLFHSIGWPMNIADAAKSLGHPIPDALDPSMRTVGSMAFDLGVNPATAEAAILKYAKLRGIEPGTSFLRGAQSPVDPGEFTAVKQQAIEKAARQAALEGPTDADQIKRAAGFALNPLDKTIEATGEGMYGSVFKDENRLNASNAARPLSDIGFENNVMGTPYQRERQFADLENQLGQKARKIRGDVYTADPGQVASKKELLSRAKADLRESSQIPGQTQAADQAWDSLKGQFNDAVERREEAFARAQKNASTEVPTGTENIKNFKTYPGSPGGMPEMRSVPRTKEVIPPRMNADDFTLPEVQQIKESMQQKQFASKTQSAKAIQPRLGIDPGEAEIQAERQAEAYGLAGQSSKRWIEDTADRVSAARPNAPGMSPNLGGQLYDTNADIQAIKSAAPAIEKNASLPITARIERNWVPTALGMAAGSAGGYYGGHGDPYLTMLGTAIGTGLTSQPARTAVGLALGKGAPYIGQATRAGLAEHYDPLYHNYDPEYNFPRSPWLPSQ